MMKTIKQILINIKTWWNDPTYEFKEELYDEEDYK